MSKLWKKDELLSSQNFNEIEEGVAEINDEYVPYEWKAGDVITATRLNAIEQGIANASGDSDFTTAEVTIRGATGDEATVLRMPNIQDSNKRTGIEATEVNATSTQKTYNVPLFKGHCLIKVVSGNVDGLTGNVTLDRGWLDVTGNCGLTGYYVQH